MKSTCVMLLCAVSVMATGCAPQKKKQDAVAAPSAATVLSVVDAKGAIDVEGGVIYVAARTEGTVSEVLVQEGDRVAPGEVLANLEDKQQRLAAITAASAVSASERQEILSEVELKAAEREYMRIAPLAVKDIMPVQRLDQALDNIEKAKAGLRQRKAKTAAARAEFARAEHEIEKTIVRAPLGGKILRRFANPGQRTSSLYVTALFELEPDTPRIVRADVSESLIQNISVNQECSFASEADPSKKYTTNIKRIGSIIAGKRFWSDSGSDAIDGRFVDVVFTAENSPFLLRQRVLVNCPSN